LKIHHQISFVRKGNKKREIITRQKPNTDLQNKEKNKAK